MRELNWEQIRDAVWIAYFGIGLFLGIIVLIVNILRDRAIIRILNERELWFTSFVRTDLDLGGYIIWSCFFLWPLVIWVHMQVLLETPEGAARRYAEEKLRRQESERKRIEEIARKAEQERLSPEAEKKRRENIKRLWEQDQQLVHKRSISQMAGEEFETFLGLLFTKMGYKTEMTPPGADQGADLIITEEGGRRIAVQAKRWKGNVGNRAIQEIMAGKAFYKCDQGWVVITSCFTPSARALAEKDPSILLIDGDKLLKLSASHLPDKPPPFDSMEIEYVKE